MPKGIPINHSDKESAKQYKRDYNNSRYDPLKNKDNKLKKAYGIGLEEYNSLFIKQEGCCAVCGIHQSSLTRSLAVDHCHSSGKVRGLLCGKCNTALGLLNESEQIMKNLISYMSEAGMAKKPKKK